MIRGMSKSPSLTFTRQNFVSIIGSVVGHSGSPVTWTGVSAALLCVSYRKAPDQFAARCHVVSNQKGSGIADFPLTWNQRLNPAGQDFHRERLGQDVHAGIKVAVADHGVLGIAGDEQHRQLRPCDPCRVR
jgi:hypothetical protein